MGTSVIEKNAGADTELKSRQDEYEARAFLKEELGIFELRTPGKFRPWTCMSCLLSQLYNLYCLDPEGDEKFTKEVE